MSHYSADYEHEEETRRELYKKQVVKSIDLLREFRAKHFNTGVTTPQRFIDSLEDFENWLRSQK
jgi:hypothetical protein